MSQSIALSNGNDYLLQMSTYEVVFVRKTIAIIKSKEKTSQQLSNDTDVFKVSCDGTMSVQTSINYEKVV